MLFLCKMWTEQSWPLNIDCWVGFCGGFLVSCWMFKYRWWSFTVGFWGDINFFHEHRHDIPPMKIYNVGVCLVQFLKFFMEPFLRNCNFKIFTQNQWILTQKHKILLKSTFFIQFGHAIWQMLTIFCQKKESGLILAGLYEKNGWKRHLKLKTWDFLISWFLKCFCIFNSF